MRYPTSPVLPAPCFPCRSWDRIMLLGTALVLGLVAGRALGSDAQPAAPTSKTNLLAIGQPAPDFVARDLNEQAHALEVYQGHPLILNFWATWCVPCRHEMPLLQTVYETYKDAGLVILAVSQDTQDRVEIRQPQGEEIVLREAFTLTRTEIRGTLDPQATRPLTEQEKDSLKPYLQASTYVIVNDDIKTYHGPDRSKVDYYFGNLDERRVVWSVGRDLRLDPPQDAGPVNALTKMYVEVDGKEYTAWTRKFTYKEL